MKKKASIRKIANDKTVIVIPYTFIFVFLSFFIPFSVYVYTLNPTISAYADAAEFPTFAYISGFAHPPGYPLFILLIKLFQILPFGNPAMMANLCAAFFGATAISLFYLVIKMFINNSYIALATALTLAFTRIFWRNSVASEAFSLLAFFIMLILLFYIMWLRTKKKKYFYLFLLSSGFAMGHHQTVIFVLIPIFLSFLISRQWKNLKWRDYPLSIVLVALGFLPYLYILFYAAPNTILMNWNKPETFAGLFELITRQSYGILTLTTSARESDFIPHVIGILNLTFGEFSPVGYLMVLIGICGALARRLKILLFSLFVIVSLFIFSFYSGMPSYYPLQIQYLERFSIISVIFISLLIGIGYYSIYKLAVLFAPNNNSKPGFTKNKILKAVIIVALFFVPLIIFKHNFEEVNQRDNYFLQYFVDDMLSSVPKNSMVVVEADSVINAVFYDKYVLRKRQDVCYVVSGMLQSQQTWYLDEIKSSCPGVLFPANNDGLTYFTDFMKLNSKHKKIFFMTPDTDANTGFAMPRIRRGIMWEYSDQSGVSVEKLEQEILAYLKKSKNLENIKTYPPDWAESDLVFNYAQNYIFLAQLNHDDIKKSEKYYKQAIKIAPYNHTSYLELGDDYEMNDMSEKSIPLWKKAAELLNIDQADLKEEIEEKIKNYKFQIKN